MNSGAAPASGPAAARQALRLTRDELLAWGERLGADCVVPLVVRLQGELGAGKTTLAQAICRGFGVTEQVTSPTFSLVHRYDTGRAPVHHVDLYRLRGPQDLANLGWDDILAEPGLLLVEWPERAGPLLPPGVSLRLSYDARDPDVRTLQLETP